MRSLRTSLVFGAFAVLSPLAARAATFDARGMLAFDAHAVTSIDFDSGTEQTGVTYKQDATALQGAMAVSVSSRRCTLLRDSSG